MSTTSAIDRLRDFAEQAGKTTARPTGALVEPGLADPTPIEAVTRTACRFCGVGCSLDVRTRNGTIAAVTPALDGPVNRGHACVKGRFAHGFATAPDRLTTPLLCRNGDLEPATWGEAFQLIGQRIGRIVADHGPDAVAAISLARATFSLPGHTGEPAHLRLDGRGDRLSRVQGDRGAIASDPR
jgi:formate dehydrogenase major subunit